MTSPSSSAAGLSLDELRAEALALLAGLADGDSLDPLARAFVEFGVRVCVTTLDTPGAARSADRALELGATADQLQEILVFVSGVGMHTLMEGTRTLAEVVNARGQALPDRDAAREQLWDRYVGGSSYWAEFESKVPGFLDALLRLSPEGFDGFMQYGAIPARTRQVSAVIKEYIAVATDATPTHRYLPGMRMHLRNAITLGAGRRALLEVLDIAAAAPIHRGVR